MNDSLYIAATGMQAQQLSIDAVANNIANMATAGYKKSRVNFQALMHGEASVAPLENHASVGLGIGVTGMSRDFAPAALQRTDAPMDLAIEGNGFIELVLADGSRGYTRGGTLALSKEGFLSTAAGHLLKPGIQVPPNTVALAVAADGRVSASVSTQDTPVEIGQLELVRFANPSALASVTGGVYAVTPDSGEALAMRGGDAGIGHFVQGALESSNVALVDEMVTLMAAQRAYELSSKLIQASDELMQLTNNLRR